MDYKQKYLKYKQKYLRLLKDQKGGKPFLMDILAGQVFSYLFERNQRLLELIYTRRLSVMVQPLGNFTLNPKYRLKLLGRSGISILLATRLVEGLQNNRLKLQLAKRILSHTHKLPKISQPTLAATLDINKEGHSFVTSVAFHPTAPLLATCSDKTVKLWRFLPDGSEASCVATLEGHNSIVQSVVFHSTFPILATGSRDKTIKLWRFTPDGSAATYVATLAGHSKPVFSVAFHPTAPILATSSFDNTAKLWRFEPNGLAATCVATLAEHSQVVWSVAFHPSLPLLATGSNDKTAKLWRFTPDGSEATCVATLNHSSIVWSVAFHPTAPLLATGSDDTIFWSFLSDGSAATNVVTLDSRNGGHTDGIQSVVFHPTAPLLVTGSFDKTTKLWHLVNTSDGSILAATCLATLDSHNGGHSESVISVAFHPTVPLLATGSIDKSVKLWKL